MSIAAADKWKDKTTIEMKETTERYRTSFNGRLAEIVGQYLKKGSQVYVVRSLRKCKRTDEDGIEKFTTEIRADQMRILGSRQVMGSPTSQDDAGGYQLRAAAASLRTGSCAAEGSCRVDSGQWRIYWASAMNCPNPVR